MTVSKARVLRTRLAGAGVILSAASALAGCASAGTGVPEPAASAATFPLATSLAAAGGGAWAVVPVGGSGTNLFWELFTRPAAGGHWALVTPPGIADNGGLVAAAPAAGQRLDVAIRPSQGLRFSPFASTGDSGKTWATGVVDAAVAADPDAFAADSGKMLALLTDGTIDRAAVPGNTWTRLAAPGAVAAASAARSCQITQLTAVALTPSGAPLAAASCARPGVAGIFAWSGGAWEAAGPTLTGKLASQPVQVLRLTATATGNIALLQAGTGSGASLVAAWSADGIHWTESSPLPAGSGQIRASGTGSGGALWLLLADGRAAAIAGPGMAWRDLPAPPRGTAALADGTGGAFDALAVSGSKLTVSRLGKDGAWAETQVLTVPLQYGSSG